jgi:hypothetical protein
MRRLSLISLIIASLITGLVTGCSEAVVNINVNSKKPLPSAGPGFSSGSPRTILTAGDYKLAAQVQSEAQAVLTSGSYSLKAQVVVIE